MSTNSGVELEIMDIVGNLPVEISTTILRNLDYESLLSASEVSERWLDICESDPVLSLNLSEGLHQRLMDRLYHENTQKTRAFVNSCFEKRVCCEEPLYEIQCLLEFLEGEYERYKKTVGLRRLKKLSERESEQFQDKQEHEDRNMMLQIETLQLEMYEAATTGGCRFCCRFYRRKLQDWQ